MAEKNPAVTKTSVRLLPIKTSLLSLQPSHSDKAANPEVLRWVTELSKLRKELKGKRPFPPITPPPHYHHHPLPNPAISASLPIPIGIDSLARTQAAQVRRGLAAADPPA